MIRIFDKICRVAGIIADALAQLWERAGLMFLSKRENAKRTSGRVEARKRKEMEDERLDRLRNPSNYQGR